MYSAEESSCKSFSVLGKTSKNDVLAKFWTIWGAKSQQLCWISPTARPPRSVWIKTSDHLKQVLVCLWWRVCKSPWLFHSSNLCPPGSRKSSGRSSHLWQLLQRKT
jgi:hypothetical protein